MKRFLVFGLLALAGLSAQTVRVREVRAVLTAFTGEVRVRFPGGLAEEPARELLLLEDGTVLKVPGNAEVTLVCGDGRFRVLRQDARVDADLCWQGVEAPGGRTLARPDAGRLRAVGRSLELLGDARGLPNEPDPVLLAPRSTWLLGGRPAIRWTALEGALQYRIVLTGAARFTEDLKTEEVVCAEETIAGEVRRVCSWAWPADRPEVVPGEPYFLEVWARRGLAGSWRTDERIHRFEVLEEAAAQEVRRQAEEVRRLAVDGFTRDLLLAGTYAQAGLLGEAVDLYAKAAAASGAPELKVTLGDLYQKTGLLREAGRVYRQVIEQETGSAAEAAAEHGLGQVYAAWNRPRSAVEHFERAREVFTRLGLTHEADAVEREAVKSRQKLPGGGEILPQAP